MSTPDRPDHSTADAVVTGRGEVPQEWRATTDALADLRSLSEATAPTPSPALAELLASGGAAAHAPATTDLRTNPVRRFVTRSLATLGITGKVALASTVALAAVGGGAAVTREPVDVAVEVEDDGLEPELPELPEQAAEAAREATAGDDEEVELEELESEESESVDEDDVTDGDDEPGTQGPADEIAAFRADNDEADEPLEGCEYGQTVASIARGDDLPIDDDKCDDEESDENDSEESEENDSEESEESEDSDEEESTETDLDD